MVFARGCAIAAERNQMQSPVIVFDHVTKTAGATGGSAEVDAKLAKILGSGTRPSSVSGATPPRA